MLKQYENWLRNRNYDEGTIKSQLYRITRIETHHGCLDAHFEYDDLASLIQLLTYSSADQRSDRPNPSNIPFSGNARNNLASYKSAVFWYHRFRRDPEASDEGTASTGPKARILTKTARFVPQPDAKTLFEFGMDGRLALEEPIASSQYRTLAQAVASLTLFTHPDTVAQTGGKALFRSIRNARRVGEIDEHRGRLVLLDDNKSPKDAFLWANGLPRRGKDTQFNHVYANSLDADAYTALPNICMTPAFIAKLTDTSPAVCHILQYRSFELYEWTPAGHRPPKRPDGYEQLEWAPPLPAIGDVMGTIEKAMTTKPKDRTVLAAKQLGWLFGKSLVQ